MLQTLDDIRIKCAAGCVFSAPEVLDLVVRVESLQAQVEDMEEEQSHFSSSASSVAEELERTRVAMMDAQQRLTRVTGERNEARALLAQVAAITGGK